MKNITIKSLPTKELTNEKLSICKLKNEHWIYGIKSHLMWFNKFVKKEDVHILMYSNKNLIGYNLLRKRKFLYKKQQKNYFYFDTIILQKKYRNIKLGSTICHFSMKIIKKEKLHSILICKNNTEKFYKRNKWKKFYKKNFKTLDKVLKKNDSVMCFNQEKSMSRKIIEYSID